MNTHVINKTYPILSAEHPAENLILRGVSGLLIALVCLYLYFVSASVLNVIASSQAERGAAALEGAVGSLQREYFALSEDISPETAAALGLSPVVEISYMHRPGSVGLAQSEDNAI